MEKYDYAYHSSEWRGTPKFSCMVCPFYVFHNEAAMVRHSRATGHGRTLGGDLTIESYIADQRNEMPRSVIITLAYLCWNTRQASVEGAVALVEEAARLRELGCFVNVVVLDNGSQDGTSRSILTAFENAPKHLYLIKNNRNEGISRARNQLMREALELDSHYILFMDGDIEVVPLSSYVMARYLECHKQVGCIGAYSANWTRDRERSAKHIFEIPECSVKKDIECAWTQYGLFRADMFRQGLKFDETGPLGEPGWGFEDDDLYFQMRVAGWENRYFGGMKYLHRNIRSSWPNLEQSGVDIPSMFKKRKDYVVEKWKRNPLISGRIHLIAAQQMPTPAF